MVTSAQRTYLEVTEAAGRDFVQRGLQGPVVMLNLLKYRQVADYSAHPELAPSTPVSGEAAYGVYMEHTLPLLQRSGGSILFWGRGAPFLIGPTEEAWDAMLLVKQASVESFLAFASDPAYLAGVGHRIAALEDSRLLPLTEEAVPGMVPALDPGGA
ncbi:MAG: DUF1330 domain-containing protein [Polyangiaceae bacterium]|nr:DUF1330 domain-containing protein [Polyangiaceae bacterium]MCB9610571.1 DUF1330 domain-containing protein [Polyangiaceae bacterium]